MTPMPRTLFRLTLTLLIAMLSGAATAREALPPASDLRADAAAAQHARLPIVLFFHSRTCPFCRQVEELYLPLALQDNGATPRFILRTVDIDVAQPMQGFDGRATDMRAFARAQGVRMVPHLRFVGPDGQPLAPDLIGLNPPDFYAGYLDDSIRQAFEKLRKPAR
jgi:thioredoxin-related protein